MTDTWFERGHVAIVTGGSQGLGKAVTRSLLKRGLSVVIDARGEAELEVATAELRAFGDVSAIAGDVADPQHVHMLIGYTRDRYGRLDLLINNASTLGEVPLPPVRDLSPHVLERIFSVNLFAPVHLTVHALPLLERAGGPATIVNITSDAGAEAYPAWGGYGASKAALEHISRVLAAEIEGSNVRVLVVDPGDMNTAMHRDAIPDADPSKLRNPNTVAEALLDAVAGMRTPYARIGLEIPQPV